ncbi:hypothetical protein JG687_00005684 [Phytophthora cactorum]|uniref:Uncharacterized protein n=1 Tax=Phytophthora cactorum TaxID=29920 RepID=A0A8T1UN36_9STRA|nr:hypothetical protein JG687_00005684 [Phytophthora cactorum]
MTTSSTVSAPCARSPPEPPLMRTATEQRLDARRRSVTKITGRKLRVPRKFVVTDVPDTPEQPRDDDEEDNNNNHNNNNYEDLSASSSSVRKGKTQVRGRFTITDLSPESPEASPEREDLSVSMGPRALEITHQNNNQSQTVFDHHLEFLEKETHEMKSVLENMVATNAQWIEALTSAGLVQANSAPRLSEVSISEPVAPVESPLEKKYREVEKAYTELQAKYESVCQKSERLEVKNAMLEIRLQQQINRSTMLRSQLDKLTQYTENLIGESSEPTLHDYNSDLNSIFGEQSEAHSPTADEITSGGEYGFNYDVVKSRRQRWRGVDEECMSDTSTEGESMRKTSSPPPYERDDDNNRYFSDVELTTADLASSNNRDSCTALDSLLDAQCNQLRQSLRSKDRADGDDHVSVIESLDSLAVCPSVTNCDDEYEGDNQIGHSGPLSNGLKSDLLKHSNSVASLNYSTVSSSSSLAGYGLHLATMAQSKSGYYASVAATSLFGPHPEPYPNSSNQPNTQRDDDSVYNVLSPENLRFHDCQSLLQAAEERNAQTSATRRGFPFTTRKKANSLPGANEVPERAQSTGSLFQRFAVRRR